MNNVMSIACRDCGKIMELVPIKGIISRVLCDDCTKALKLHEFLKEISEEDRAAYLNYKPSSKHDTGVFLEYMDEFPDIITELYFFFNGSIERADKNKKLYDLYEFIIEMSGEDRFEDDHLLDKDHHLEEEK